MRSPVFVSVVSAILVMTVSVGCSKKSDTGGADRSKCDAAIGKAVDAMLASRKRLAESSVATELATKLRGVLVDRCTEDTWSDSVITCYEGATDFASIKACEKGLTPEQNQRRQAEVMKVMMAGRGRAAGAPPAPAPPAPAPATP